MSPIGPSGVGFPMNLYQIDLLISKYALYSIYACIEYTIQKRAYTSTHCFPTTTNLPNTLPYKHDTRRSKAPTYILACQASAV